MPRLPDLDRLAAYLSAAELASIREWCDATGLRFEDWPAHPACRGWLDLAVWRLMKWMRQTGRAKSHTFALQLACGSLGLNPDAHRRRWERGRARARKLATKCRSQTPKTGASFAA